MGFRFRKSFRLFPGVRLNLGKRGIGVSAGIRGLRVGVNSRGTYSSVGIPGTGISYFSQSSNAPRPAQQVNESNDDFASTPPPTKNNSGCGCALLAVFFIMFIGVCSSFTGKKSERPVPAMPGDRGANQPALRPSAVPQKPLLTAGIYQLNQAAILYQNIGGTVLSTLPVGAYFEVTGAPLHDGPRHWYQVDTYDSEGNVYPGVIFGPAVDPQGLVKVRPAPTTSESEYLDQESMVLVAEDGEKYHRSGCRTISNSSVFTIALSSARQRYGACKVCNPPR